MNQRKDDVIQSIKIYFSVRDTKKDVEPSKKEKEKDMFYNDLSCLLLKILNVQEVYLPDLETYVRRLVKEEKYEEKMFIGDKLEHEYFRHHSIYWQDYTGKCQLNHNSAELKYLVEKIMHKWYSDKINYLNFLYKCPDLIRPRRDLFVFLLQTLLKLEEPDIGEEFLLSN